MPSAVSLCYIIDDTNRGSKRMIELHLTETEYDGYRAAGGDTLPGFIRARIRALAGTAGPESTNEPHLLLRERQGELTLYSNYLMRTANAEKREFVNVLLSDELLTAACDECFEALRIVPPAETPMPDEAFEKYAGAVALRIGARVAVPSPDDPADDLTNAAASVPAEAARSNNKPERNLAVRAIFLSGVNFGSGSARQGRQLQAAFERLGKETLTLATSKAAGQFTRLELAALRAAGALLLTSGS